MKILNSLLLVISLAGCGEEPPILDHMDRYVQDLHIKGLKEGDCFIMADSEYYYVVASKPRAVVYRVNIATREYVGEVDITTFKAKKVVLVNCDFIGLR